MTVEEFTADLQRWGQNVSDMQTILTEIAGPIVDQLKIDAPEDNGHLRNSIRAKISETDIEIEMLAYGVFQNYGVKGVKSSRSPVDEPKAATIAGRPVNGTFQFGTQNYGPGPGWGAYYTGLKAQRFYNIDEISELITELVTEKLMETNQ